MTELECSVRSCSYNNEAYCCKGEILIEGKEATQPRGTCCSSFKDACECGCQNSMSEASRTIDVECEAYNCIFNEDRKCSADHIGISGGSASSSAETECSSFASR